jgi:hypothetical protein
MKPTEPRKIVLHLHPSEVFIGLFEHSFPKEAVITIDGYHYEIRVVRMFPYSVKVIDQLSGQVQTWIAR